MLKKPLKPLKKKKVAPKKIDKTLYAQVVRDYGDLPKLLKEDKFIPLLKRIKSGYISYEQLYSLSRHANIHVGTLEELLDNPARTPSLAALQYVSFPRRFYVDLAGVAFVNRGVAYFNFGGQTTKLPASSAVYCAIKTLETLPADMRNWTLGQRHTFMTAKLYGVRASVVNDLTRMPHDVAQAVDNDHLYAIRRINRYPSKAQQRKIEKESRKQNNTPIDFSFSLDQ